MKPIGPAALFLAVMNLTTVSSSSTTAPDPTRQTVPDPNVGSGSSLLISDSTTKSGLSDFSRLPESSSVSSATTITNTDHGSPSKYVPGFTQSNHSDLADSHTMNGLHVTTKLTNPTTQRSLITSGFLATSENVTIPTTTRTSTKSTVIKPTESKTMNNVATGQHNVLSPSVDSEITVPKIPEPEGTLNETNKNKSDGKNPSTPSNTKGIHIAAWCIIPIIVFSVLVGFVYKMYQKKSPAPENMEIKVSAQTPESVKLLSVKTSP